MVHAVSYQHIGPFLAEDAIRNLTNHTQVVVTWFGGNGPHLYIIRNDLDRRAIYHWQGGYPHPTTARELTENPRPMVTVWAVPDGPRRPFPYPGDTSLYYLRPFLQPGYKKPEPWGTEEYTRGSHLSICEVCGKELRLHPTESGPAYGPAGDERIELMRTCDGRLVKP